MVNPGNDFISNLSAQRERLYNWLFSCLVGPGPEFNLESENHILQGIKPLDRYQLGILFPIEKGVSGIDPTSELNESGEDDVVSEEETTSDDESPIEPVIKKRRYVPPSSAGFSFFIRGKNVRLQIVPWAVGYALIRIPGKGKKEFWSRKPCSEDSCAALTDIRPSADRSTPFQSIPVFDNNAEVFVLWRPLSDGWLVTISLSNRQELPEDVRLDERLVEKNKKSFFEVKLECIVESGEVGIYPSIDPNLLSDEDQELELQYKHKRIFAIGHGVAVDWEEIGGRVNKIRADFLPKFEIPQVSVEAEGAFLKALSIEFLSRLPEKAKNICKELKGFVTAYENWVSDKIESAKDLSKSEQRVAERIFSRMSDAVSRMMSGVHLLLHDINVSHAFGIANNAMNIQMSQYDRSLGKAQRTYRWRPFQLAFLLMVIESVVNEDSDFRDTFDLIWFPTGGGKTEAYLGLIAFLIAWRRLRYPTSGGGTTVLMRYTLRLLTQQQFQRACRLICAMELIRRKQPELGKEPISAGMWVGEATSPNNFDKARQIIGNVGSGNDVSLQKLVLDRCPWCQQIFRAPDNYIASKDQFKFRCTNKDCDFGKPHGKELYLPCNVVDEALYAEPPTLLIATIDKFARLAWEERATVFFGTNGNRPPELVIQDELHLISGALGSIAGLYEAALDTVLCYRGVFPKYIASTATIRMAKQQVQRLYGRPVGVFPPPGLSSDDSFFARTVPIEERPGRLFVGYLAHNLTRQRSMAPLAAALLVAPNHLFKEQKDAAVLLDAWWTMVVYHGSLKGVGNSHNILNIDVLEYLAKYSCELNHQDYSDFKPRNDDSIISKEPHTRLSQRADKIAQLTSLSSVEENAVTFKRLEREYNDPQCLDVVLATNMISVGLDVSRLALMVINGQPLTTAEYIQTSSRVGRAEVPGLVIANYYKDQARSLSHYESFRPYHESFYRFVEPSSITPFTYQARTRALHAALVIAVRHCCPNLLGNETAGDFETDSHEVRKVLELLTTRCSLAEPEYATEIQEHLQMLVEQWKHEVLRCRKDLRRLDYQAPSNNQATDRLLHNHGDRIKGLWVTLQSMRNVEKTAFLKLL